MRFVYRVILSDNSHLPVPFGVLIVLMYPTQSTALTCIRVTLKVTNNSFLIKEESVEFHIL